MGLGGCGTRVEAAAQGTLCEWDRPGIPVNMYIVVFLPIAMFSHVSVLEFISVVHALCLKGHNFEV